MNILRDVGNSGLPADYNYPFFKDHGKNVLPELDRQMGKCKIAIVVKNAKDYAMAHQMTVATRLIGTSVERKPFREAQKAKAWLNIPDDYEIIYPETN